MAIHIECLPDETLLKKVGFTRKEVKHHSGKSRVFADILKSTNQVAMVDEDPGSAKTSYESRLKFQKEKHGISFFMDEVRNNKVFVLKVKLEDWVVSVCKKSNVDITKFGLPAKPNELHSVINNKLHAFERLLDELINKKSEAIQTLENWLKDKIE